MAEVHAEACLKHPPIYRRERLEVPGLQITNLFMKARRKPPGKARKQGELLLLQHGKLHNTPLPLPLPQRNYRVVGEKENH